MTSNCVCFGPLRDTLRDSRSSLRRSRRRVSRRALAAPCRLVPEGRDNYLCRLTEYFCTPTLFAVPMARVMATGLGVLRHHTVVDQYELAHRLHACSVRVFSSRVAELQPVYLPPDPTSRSG
jgi:hypothetical protein